MTTFIKSYQTVLFALMVFSIACNQTNNSKSSDTTNEASKALSLDTLQFAVIPFDTAEEWLFNKSYISTTLTLNEIIEIDSLLNSCVADYNNNLSKDNKKYLFIDLSVNYKRQYVPVINKKGQKEVWINCFCQTYGNSWKKSLVIADGGGSCYFNFKVNLTTNKCYNFWINSRL